MYKSKIILKDINLIPNQDPLEEKIEIIKRVGVFRLGKNITFILEDAQSMVPLLHYFEDQPSARENNWDLRYDPFFFDDNKVKIFTYKNNNSVFSTTDSQYNVIVLSNSEGEGYSPSNLINSYVNFLKTASNQKEKRKLLIKELNSDKLINTLSRSLEDRRKMEGDIHLTQFSDTTNVPKEGVIFQLTSNGRNFPKFVRRTIGISKPESLANLEKRIYFHNVPEYYKNNS